MDNKNRNYIIVGVIVVVIVVCCCCLLSTAGAGYWYYSSPTSTPAESVAPTPAPIAPPSTPIVPPPSTPQAAVFSTPLSTPPAVVTPLPTPAPEWKLLGSNFKTGAIRDKTTGLCMSVSPTGADVVSATCDAANTAQTWNFADPYLKNASKCLTIYSYMAQNKNPDGSYKLVSGDCTGTGWSDASITGRHWKLNTNGSVQSKSSGLTTPYVVTGAPTASGKVSLATVKSDNKDQIWETI